MKNSRREFLYLGSIGFVLLLTLSGCCRIFPKLCSDPPPQPEWTRTWDYAGDGEVLDIVRGDGVFVAVGYDGSSYTASKRAAVWSSPDGITWTHSPQDNLIFTKGMEISSIYCYSGLIAAGMNRDGEPAIWKAEADGSDWRSVEPDFSDQSGLVIRDKNLIQIKDIIVIPPDPTGGGRKEIAVGAIYTSVGGVGQAAMWKHLLGSNTWREIYREPLKEDSDKFGGSIIYSIIETSAYITDNSGPAYIAVGSYDEFRGVPLEADQDASIWISDDGENWSRLQTDYTVFASDQNSGLEKDQRLYAAMVQGIAIYVGGYDAHQISTGSMIWRSLDNGATWERITDAGEENMPVFKTDHTVHSLSSTNLPFGYGEVAVGAQISQGYQYAAFWWGGTGFPRWRGGTNALSEKGALKQVASDGNVLVVVGQVGLAPAIWTLAIPTD